MVWYSEYLRFTLNTEVEKCGNDLVFRVFVIYSEYGNPINIQNNTFDIFQCILNTKGVR